MAVSVGSSPVMVDYDERADVLYISIGQPKPCFVREDPEVEGLHYRYSFDDRSLCGVTVVWYSLQDKKELQKRIPFQVQLP